MQKLLEFHLSGHEIRKNVRKGFLREESLLSLKRKKQRNFRDGGIQSRAVRRGKETMEHTGGG